MTFLIAARAKMRIHVSSKLSAIVALTLACCAAEVYFPQSDLQFRLPYLDGNRTLKPSMPLITMRTLINFSTLSNNTQYEIVAPGDLFSNLDSTTGTISLVLIPEKDQTETIVVKARNPHDERDDAVLEIKITPRSIKGKKINCTEFVEDMCFWKMTRYKIYENQPLSMLGNLGPGFYQKICPNLSILEYKLMNATNFLQVMDDQLFAQEWLDRDSLAPPKGTGSKIYAGVRCIVRNSENDAEFKVDKTITVDILDQDDNPPVLQSGKTNYKIKLREFSAGDRLDNNDLMVVDADSAGPNIYNVRILDDNLRALNMTYDTLPVERPNQPEVPSSTAVYSRIYARTTLLPKSPYKVILQVTDETLLPGHGQKSVNISLEFIGPQHHQTTTPSSVPMKKPIVYPGSVRVARDSSPYFRVVQPLTKVNAKISFNVSGSDAFNITKRGGIIYVSNTTSLRFLPSDIKLKVEWQFPNRSRASTYVKASILDTHLVWDHQCSYDHSCANAESWHECESMCGIGSGLLNDTKCSWRRNNSTVGDATMTEKYQTCSPNLNFCPDNVCDDLEHLDLRICPQDCTIESEVHFGVMNKGGRGIHSGMGTCTCNDMMQCTCFPFLEETKGSPEVANKNGNLTTYFRKDRNNHPPPPPPPPKPPKDEEAVLVQSSTDSCGVFCMFGVLIGGFFVLSMIVGSFTLWKCRYSKKSSCRDCNHGAENGANALGMLPTDYIERGDGLLIGLDSFPNSANQSLFIPRSHSPDPKWEFPRAQLSIEQVLGEGEFGRVLKAKAVDINGCPGSTTVAVKTLKEDACASELADLLSEYQLLKEAQHPNVIRLLGACTSPGGPIYLIIEFAEFGSLRNYLRKSRHLEVECRLPLASLVSPSEDQDLIDSSVYAIKPRDILSFAWQISKGMAYLSEIKLVHRDLAARNVLLASGKVCKISDFGLTRDVYEDDAYLKRSKGRVPVKWMAPESLADHVYTSKSDVWSFGILLWELVTLGASPYPGVDVHNLYNLLKAGYRMERPKNCSEQLYKVMLSCWRDEPGLRPSFKELTCRWEHMLEDGTEYLDLNPRAFHNQTYFTIMEQLERSEKKEDCVLEQQSNPANYLCKPSNEPVTKSDQVNKLQTLWQDVTKPSYVNDRVINADTSHYESPIKVRNNSVTSSSDNDLTPTHEKPQSYLNMQGTRRDQDLLLFDKSEIEKPKPMYKNLESLPIT